jgi:HD-like signal output (HDOD) protein
MEIEAICKKAQSLPACPAILPALLKLLARADASLKDLEAIIAQDTSLSAAVLKMANSAYYGGRGKFGDLPQALLQLGFTRTHELVLTVSGGRWNSVDLAGYSWQPGDYFRHSFTVAVVAKHIAKKIGYAQAEMAYVAGLMHEAGKLALAYAYPEGIEKVRQRQSETGEYWIDAERAVLGYAHTDVSRALLNQWRFPDALISAACHYPYPEQAEEDNRRLVGIIHIAKHLTIQIGIGNGEDAFWLPVSESILEELSLSEGDLEGLLESSIDAVRKLLQENMLTGAIQI